MKTLKLFSLLILSLFFVNLVSGLLVQTNINTEQGLQVFYPPFKAVTYNQTHTLYIHVSNISNGVPFPNTEIDCYTHIYDSTGSHVLESEAFVKDANGWDLEYEILYGNFTEAGEINTLYIWCNNTAQNLGGSVKGSYEITSNGKPTPEGIVILGFCFIMIFLFSMVVFFLVRATGLIIDANFDILDISYAWGLYFGLLGINLLAGIYLGNLIISEWLELFVTFLGFPLIIIPVVAFFLSLFRTKKKEKEQKAEW